MEATHFAILIYSEIRHENVTSAMMPIHHYTNYLELQDKCYPYERTIAIFKIKFKQPCHLPK